MAFRFTDRMVHVSNDLWEITSLIGAVICFLVLVLICGLSFSAEARRILDRVSFRLLVIALVANVVYAITNTVGGQFTGPTWGCSMSIWLLQLSLELSQFLTFCIALNLQLVLVHGRNNQRLERYYFVGSAGLALALTVPAYASKQYGWDSASQDCWYSNPDMKAKLAWQLATQLLWTLLTVAGEFVSAVIVFVYMCRHKCRRHHEPLDLFTKSPSGAPSEDVLHENAKSDNYDARLQAIVFRIWLYPVVSGIINATSVVLVFVGTTDNGVHNTPEYIALLINDFLYGARAAAYGLLAATDPALLRAVSYIYRRWRTSKPQRGVDVGIDTTASTSYTVNHPTHHHDAFRILDSLAHLRSGLSGSERGIPAEAMQSTPSAVSNICTDRGGFFVTPFDREHTGHGAEVGIELVPNPSGSGIKPAIRRSRSLGPARLRRRRTSRAASFGSGPAAPGLSGIQMQIELTSVSVQYDDEGMPVSEYDSEFPTPTIRSRFASKPASPNRRPWSLATQSVETESDPGNGSDVGHSLEGDEAHTHTRGRRMSRRAMRDVEWAGELARGRYTERAPLPKDTDVPGDDDEIQTAFKPATFNATHTPLVSKSGTLSSEIPSDGAPFVDTEILPSHLPSTSLSLPPGKAVLPRETHKPYSMHGHGFTQSASGEEIYGAPFIRDQALTDRDSEDVENSSMDHHTSGLVLGVALDPLGLKTRRALDAKRRAQRRIQREHSDLARRANEEDFLRTL